MKAKADRPGFAVATTKFLFGLCNCMVDSDVGTCDLSLVQGILYVFLIGTNGRNFDICWQEDAKSP